MFGQLWLLCFFLCCTRVEIQVAVKKSDQDKDLKKLVSQATELQLEPEPERNQDQSQDQEFKVLIQFRQQFLVALLVCLIILYKSKFRSTDSDNMLALQPQDKITASTSGPHAHEGCLNFDYEVVTDLSEAVADAVTEAVLCLSQVTLEVQQEEPTVVTSATTDLCNELTVVGSTEIMNLADRIQGNHFGQVVPEKIEDGCGGVYLLGNRESRAVFKPVDEEIGATGQMGYLREVAAYVIDDGMAGVPHTGIACVPWNIDSNSSKNSKAHAQTLKIGSLQQFVPETESAADLGPALFAQDDVHRIGILDLRIVNCDRHSGNMLFSSETKRLVPIDHGLCFPNAFTELGKASFDWLLYPSAKKPFSKQLLAEIEAIDAQKDMETLESFGIGEEAQLSLWMSTTLLQIAAKSGKTLYDIGCMVQRQGDRSEPSVLETLLAKALEIVQLYKVNFWSVFVECIYNYLNTL